MRKICINFVAMETVDKKIREAGLRATPQRRLIYGVMQELCHATLEEIAERVAAQDSIVNLSTVYRILDSFVESHLLSVVYHPDTGKSYYDITVGEHHHLFDGQSIADFKDDGLTEVVRQYLVSHNFKDSEIEDIQVQITINHTLTSKNS